MVKQKNKKGANEMIKQKLFNFNSMERSADEVTSRAGLIIHDGFMRALKIDKIVDKHMPCAGSNRGYKASEYVRPLSLLQYGGGRHIADLRELRDDKTLQKIIGMKVIPSDSAIGDWCVKMGKGQGIEGMDKVHKEAAVKILKMDTSNKEYTLWADPTIIDLADKAYAEKLYTGDKGDRCMLVGLKEVPILVHHKYRKGNAMGGTKEALQIGFEVVEASGKKIKHTACDSEFYNAEVINFLHSKKSTFTIVADKDRAVKEVIKRINETEWRPYYDEHAIKTDREIAVAVHCMNETEAFNLIILRWEKEQLSLFEPERYFYHAIATDLDIEPFEVIKIHNESVPDACRAVWKYNERAQMENIIKELKIGVGMEHMPCNTFEANAMYFSIGVLTYNLIVAQKYFVIKEGFEKAMVTTLRWKVVQVSAWIAAHAGRIKFKIAATVEKFEHYIRMMKRLEAISALPA